jgi:exopolysaccharide production protein ExoZ
VREFLNETIMRAKLTSLQILRAIAALMVVFYHFSLEGSRYSLGPSWIVSCGLGRLGEAGVDLFFVLSGFIMIYTAEQIEGLQVAGRFLRKRALRIYPAYWFWTTVLLVLWKAHLALVSHRYSNVFLLKSYLLVPVFSGENLHPFLNQGWTLTYELMFYLLFSVVLAIGFRRLRVVMLITLIASAYTAGFLFAQGSVARQILTNALIFEFGFGVIAGAMFLRFQTTIPISAQHRLSRVCLLLGLVLLIVTTKIHGAEQARVLFYGVPAFFVVLGTAFRSQRSYHMYLVFLGDASYSIYLMHGMGVMVFATLLRRGGRLQHLPLDLLIASGTLLLVPVCAWGYLLVECPILHCLRRMGSKRGEREGAASVELALGQN